MEEALAAISHPLTVVVLVGNLSHPLMAEVLAEVLAAGLVAISHLLTAVALAGISSLRMEEGFLRVGCRWG